MGEPSSDHVSNTSALLDQCLWPALSHRHNKALRELVSFIIQSYDVLGIIVSGSIIRGNPNAGSDFDTYVIHAKPERQRIQKFFHGVPAEIFLNPPAAIRSYFRDEPKSGSPCTAHMLTTGFVILDRDPVVQTLVSEAKASLDQGPDLSAQALMFKRYGAADRLENAVDIAEFAPANASLILHSAVEEIIEYYFLAENRWLPRVKERLAALAESDPEIGALAYQFYSDAELPAKFTAAEQLAQKILGETGFFEWESTPEEYL